MTSIHKIITKNGPSKINLADYVGEAGEFILDPNNPQILYQDGSTPGGIPIGATNITGATISLVTSAPNDSVNAGLIMASGGTGTMDIVLSPNGLGAFTLSLADGTSMGGNKRGAGAVDLQILQNGKNSPTQVASGQYSFACNAANTASGYGSFACGFFNVASGQSSFAEGENNTSSNFGSHAEGYANTASANFSHAEGYDNNVSGYTSHGEGGSNTVSGQFSHAEGYNNDVSSNFSHVEGQITAASGDNSHAEGYSTTASGSTSHAEGYGTTASGNYSHAEGLYSEASGSMSHAEGNNTVADGQGSHASGQDSWTRGISYYQAYSSGAFDTLGDQQAGRLVLKAETTDGNTVTMTSNGQAASANNQFFMPSSSAMAFSGTILASSASNTAMFTFNALLKNFGGTVTIVGYGVNPLYSDAGASDWNVTIQADNTNMCMSVDVTGDVSTTIYWTAEVRSQELTSL